MADVVTIGLIGLVVGLVGTVLTILVYLQRGKPPELGFFDWLEIRRRVREARQLAYVEWYERTFMDFDNFQRRRKPGWRPAASYREILDERLNRIYGRRDRVYRGAKEEKEEEE